MDHRSNSSQSIIHPKRRIFHAIRIAIFFFRRIARSGGTMCFSPNFLYGPLTEIVVTAPLYQLPSISQIKKKNLLPPHISRFRLQVQMTNEVFAAELHWLVFRSRQPASPRKYLHKGVWVRGMGGLIIFQEIFLTVEFFLYPNMRLNLLERNE